MMLYGNLLMFSVTHFIRDFIDMWLTRNNMFSWWNLEKSKNIGRHRIYVFVFHKTFSNNNTFLYVLFSKVTGVSEVYLIGDVFVVMMAIGLIPMIQKVVSKVSNEQFFIGLWFIGPWSYQSDPMKEGNVPSSLSPAIYPVFPYIDNN